MGIRRAEEDTRTIVGDKGSSSGDKVVSVGRAVGIRIRSKIFSTNRVGNQDGVAMVGRSRPHNSKTLTRTRGCPTCLITRTRCRINRIVRVVPRTRNSKPTNLISIPTKM